jgi:hypothetical protein
MKNITEVLNYRFTDVSNYFFIINLNIEALFFSVGVTEFFTYSGVFC